MRAGVDAVPSLAAGLMHPVGGAGDPGRVSAPGVCGSLPTRGPRACWGHAGGWGEEPSWTVLLMPGVCRPAGETDGLPAHSRGKRSMRVRGRV